mgnify:CR=1 FL=1
MVLPSVFLKGRYSITQEQALWTGSVPKKRFAFPLFLANRPQAPTMQRMCWRQFRSL